MNPSGGVLVEWELLGGMDHRESGAGACSFSRLPRSPSFCGFRRVR